MTKLIFTIAALSIFLLIILRSNPRANTELVTDHPYLNKCYSFKRPRTLERSNVESSGIDCSLLPNGCVAWFAKGGGVILETRTAPADDLYQLSQVIRFHPGATSATDYYVFKPVKDGNLSSFYYTELPDCSDVQTTRAEFICLKDDRTLVQVPCD